MIQLTVKLIFDSDVLGTVWRHRCSLDRWQVPSFVIVNQAILDENAALEPVHPSRPAVMHGKVAPVSTAVPPARIPNLHSARQIA